MLLQLHGMHHIPDQQLPGCKSAHLLLLEHKPFCACVQVEKEVVKAIRQMEEVEVEVKKKKEVSSRVKQLRRQVSVTRAVLHDPTCQCN